MICVFMLGSLIRIERRRAGPKASVIGTVIGPAKRREGGVETSTAIVRCEVDGRAFEIADEIWRPTRTPKDGVRVKLLHLMAGPQFAYRPRPGLRGLVLVGLIGLSATIIAILVGFL